MKILVTGSCGSIGSEIVKELLDNKFEVVGIDNLSYSKKMTRPRKNYHFIQMDATDFKAMEKVMKGIDICVHTAALIYGIGGFHKYPYNIIARNSDMLSAVFDAAMKNKLKRVIYLSSSMVFERVTAFPTEEDEVTRMKVPLSAYGFSKLYGEYVCKAAFEQYGLKYTIIRPFNAVSNYEMPDKEYGMAHVIPDLVKKVISGQTPLEIFGTGEQTRCFTSVNDIARAVCMAVQNPTAENRDFNISSSQEISILNLAKLIWKLSGRTDEFSCKFVSSREHDVQRRVPSVKKAWSYLGFKTQYTLEQSITEYIKNYKKGVSHVRKR